MIERLKNCPNCAGILNEAGKCQYCGSKVYDFLSLDFSSDRVYPTAQTYIRIKTNKVIILAPIACPNCSMTRELIDCYPQENGMVNLNRWNTKIEATFNVVGDIVYLEEADND